MKLKTKKRVAKEIIIFFCGCILSLVIFLLIYPYNWIYESKSKHIEDSITIKKKLCDSLSYSYESKIKQQKWFFEETSKVFDLTKINTYDKNWARFKEIVDRDSIEDRFIRVWDKGILRFFNDINLKSPNQIIDFVISNTPTKSDKENFNEAKAIEKEIKTLDFEQEKMNQKILDLDEQIMFGLYAFIIILIIIYPLRFLYLLLIWSIKTIKQKEN